MLLLLHLPLPPLSEPERPPPATDALFFFCPLPPPLLAANRGSAGRIVGRCYSLDPPAAGGQGWTVSIKPPGGAAEAVVRAPVQAAVVHMMQDGDGHASVQIVAAVAADELVSDALRTALATQTAVPSAAVVEARAAGAEVVAAALNGLSAA